MLEEARKRTRVLQDRMREQGIELALFTDEASIAYLAGFWGYLSIEFGRPTFLLVRPDEEPIVVTPLMETEMVSKMTWITRISSWEDAGARRWENVLLEAIGAEPRRMWVELQAIPAIVRNLLDRSLPNVALHDIASLLGEMRMI